MLIKQNNKERKKHELTSSEACVPLRPFGSRIVPSRPAYNSFSVRLSTNYKLTTLHYTSYECEAVLSQQSKKGAWISTSMTRQSGVLLQSKDTIGLLAPATACLRLCRTSWSA